MMFPKYYRIFLWLVFARLLVVPIAAQEEEVLTILHQPGTEQGYRTWLNWGGGSLKLINHLNRISIDSIDRRAAVISNLRTAADWQRRQATVRNYMDTMLGP